MIIYQKMKKMRYSESYDMTGDCYTESGKIFLL